MEIGKFDIKITAQFIENESNQKNIEIGIKTVIASIISELKDKLILENLELVYVPNEYHQELHNFQREHGLNEYSTRNELSEGLAQMITYKIEDKEKHCVFFDKRLALALGLYFVRDQFSEDTTDLYNDSVHYFIHELAHINELEVHKITGFTSDEHSDKTPRIFNGLARDLWREYYANRLSSEIFKVNNPIIGKILDDWAKVEKKVLIFRKSYNFREMSLDEFQERTYNHLRFVLIQFIYYISILDAENSEYSIQSLIELNHCYSLKLFQIWESLNQELKHLYNGFGKWDKNENYLNIESILVEYFTLFGIKYRIVNEGIYIDVPYDELLYKDIEYDKQ